MGFFYIVLGWFAGLWLADTFPTAVPLWGWATAAVSAALTAAWMVRRNQTAALWLAVGAAVLAGGWRMTAALPTIDDNHVAAYTDQTVTVTGLITTEPDVRDRSVNVRLQEITLAVGEPDEEDPLDFRPVHGDLLVQMPRFPVYEYGTRLTVTGELEIPPEDGDFSYRAYLARQEIHALMVWPRVHHADAGRGNPFYAQVYDFKARARDTIERLLPAPESALLAGILLGVDHIMPPAVEQDFQTTGVTHIVVISGFNISILAALFLTAATPVFGRRTAAYVAIGAIAVYTIMVGAEAAVVRAAVMGTFYVIAERLLGRRSDAVGSLLLAAGAMTVINPHALWQIGFQLSFAATLSLMLYADPLTKRVRGRLQRWATRPVVDKLMGIVTEALLVTLAAQALTLPLLLYYFQQLSLISVAANFYILPAQPAIMVWGGLAVMVGTTWSVMGVPFAAVAYLFLWYTIRTAALFAQVPFALVSVPYPLGGLLITYLLVGAATWAGQKPLEERIRLWVWAKRRLGPGTIRATAVGGILLAGLWAVGQPDGRLHVHFLDVGQGDAVLIETPTGRQILVDGGYYPSVLQDHLGRRLAITDRHLDVVIATHADADHVTGLPDVLDRYTVDALWVAPEMRGSATYKAVLDTAAAHGTRVRPMTAGQVVQIGDGVRLEVVHPPARPIADGDRNENSVSVRLVYGDFSLLLTGDVEEAGERAMLDSGRPLSALVFKAGHHGAGNATGADFLAAVRPQVVVVSAGADNQFGHPHPDMVARAQAAGAAVIGTPELGTISVATDGRRMWWSAGPKRPIE